MSANLFLHYIGVANTFFEEFQRSVHSVALRNVFRILAESIPYTNGIYSAYLRNEALIWYSLKSVGSWGRIGLMRKKFIIFVGGLSELLSS